MIQNQVDAWFSRKDYSKASFHARGRATRRQIAIYGLAGTGTSTLKTLLVDALEYQGVSGGDYQRELAAQRNISSAQELSQRNALDPAKGTDRLCDEFLVRKALLYWPLIMEARLAHVVMQGKAFNVILYAGLAVRAERGRARFEKEYKRPIDLNEAKSITSDRDRLDVTRLNMLYPGSIWEQEDFDFQLDTTDLTEQEVARLVKDAFHLWCAEHLSPVVMSH